jgi:hypothetical protein
MMPPFPSSPLSAVRRVFPSTAGRLACQAGPSQHVNQLKPAPGMHCSTSGLSSPFVHLVANIGYPVLSRAAGSIVHHHEAEYSATPEVLAPVRVVLSRSIITYSTSSAPLTGTSQLHRMAAYMRCLRCAGAPRRPASGSGLSLTIPSWHAILSDLGEFDHRPFQSSDVGVAFAGFSTARHSQSSRNPFRAGDDFRGFLVHTFATACQIARPPVRI